MSGLELLGAASAILALAEAGIDLAKTAREIYKSASGVSPQIETLLRSIERFKELSAHLKTPTRFEEISPEDECILSLVAKCKTESEDLYNMLDGLRTQHGSVVSSIARAAKLKLSEKKINLKLQRLKSFRKEIQFYLTVAIYNRPSLISAHLRKLSQRAKSFSYPEQGALKIFHEKFARFEGTKMKDLEANPHDPNATSSRPQDIYELNAAAVKINQQLRILESLKFEHMNQRQHQITEKERETFEWIFHTRHADSDLHFGRWLRSDHDTFWIYGKPGSGKSTLMKAISQDPRVKENASHWTLDKRLVVCSFYLWKAGTAPQKTCIGILRSILYQVYQQCIDILSRDFKLPYDGYDEDFLSSAQNLQRLLHQVIQTTRGSAKFLLLIDGLDEHAEGADTDLTDVLTPLRDLSNVKLCVSSRDRHIFRSVFGSDAQFVLPLHKYTADDIAAYVRSKLEQDSTFQELKDKDPRYARLVRTIVDKAEGVFIWVFFVVRDVRNNFPDGDTLHELQERVDRYPSDLNDFFTQMLNSIKVEHHKASARVILISIALETFHMPLLVAYFVFQKIDRNFDVFQSQLSPYTHEQVRAIRERTAIQLKARCLDFLEVSDTSLCRGLFGNTIHFMHRTAYDFIRQDKIFLRLRARAGTGFSPKIASCEAILAILKIHPLDNRADFGFCANLQPYGLPYKFDMPIRHLITTLKDILPSERSQYSEALLDQAEETLHRSFASSKAFQKCFEEMFSSRYFLHNAQGSAVLFRAIQYGYFPYVIQRIIETPSYGREVLGWPVLYVALACKPRDAYSPLPELTEFVRTCIHYGADPNAHISTGDKNPNINMPTTPWTAWLKSFSSSSITKSLELDDLLMTLLRAGADPMAIIEMDHDFLDRAGKPSNAIKPDQVEMTTSKVVMALCTPESKAEMAKVIDDAQRSYPTYILLQMFRYMSSLFLWMIGRQ